MLRRYHCCIRRRRSTRAWRNRRRSNFESSGGTAKDVSPEHGGGDATYYIYVVVLNQDVKPSVGVFVGRPALLLRRRSPPPMESLRINTPYRHLGESVRPEFPEQPERSMR